jgi:hypothetical protein
MKGIAKNQVMIGVIVVCLVAAGAITFKNLGKKGPDLSPFKGQLTWVLCRNQECKHAYQMDLAEYYKFIVDNADPRSQLPPPITCPQCEEPSAYKAVKCAKCEEIFEEGAVPKDFVDRCPNEECGYSQKEVDRKEAAAKRRGGG